MSFFKTLVVITACVAVSFAGVEVGRIVAERTPAWRK